jgi:DNA-binding response OmpR family regulator
VQLDLGYLSLRRGQWGEAESAFAEAATTFEDVGDDVRQAMALNGLGDVAAVNGDFAAARTYYQGSLELAQRRHSVADEGRALLRLAGIALRSADREAAHRYAEQASEIFHRIGMFVEAARAADLTNEIAASPPTLLIDGLTSRVWIRGQEKHVAPQEFALLRLLCEKAGTVCTHAEIRNALFPNTEMLVPTSQTLVYPLISNLRQVLEIVPDQPQILLRKHGKGYLLTVQCATGTR